MYLELIAYIEQPREEFHRAADEFILCYWMFREKPRGSKERCGGGGVYE
jgi:hypothetical protein